MFKSRAAEWLFIDRVSVVVESLHFDTRDQSGTGVEGIESLLFLSRFNLAIESSALVSRPNIDLSFKIHRAQLFFPRGRTEPSQDNENVFARNLRYGQHEKKNSRWEKKNILTFSTGIRQFRIAIGHIETNHLRTKREERDERFINENYGAISSCTRQSTAADSYGVWKSNLLDLQLHAEHEK